MICPHCGKKILYQGLFKAECAGFSKCQNGAKDGNGVNELILELARAILGTEYKCELSSRNAAGFASLEIRPDPPLDLYMKVVETCQEYGDAVHAEAAAYLRSK